MAEQITTTIVPPTIQPRRFRRQTVSATTEHYDSPRDWGGHNPNSTTTYRPITTQYPRKNFSDVAFPSASMDDHDDSTVASSTRNQYTSDSIVTPTNEPIVTSSTEGLYKSTWYPRKARATSIIITQYPDYPSTYRPIIEDSTDLAPHWRNTAINVNAYTRYRRHNFTTITNKQISSTVPYSREKDNIRNIRSYRNPILSTTTTTTTESTQQHHHYNRRRRQSNPVTTTPPPSSSTTEDPCKNCNKTESFEISEQDCMDLFAESCTGATQKSTAEVMKLFRTNPEKPYGDVSKTKIYIRFVTTNSDCYQKISTLLDAGCSNYNFFITADECWNYRANLVQGNQFAIRPRTNAKYDMAFCVKLDGRGPYHAIPFADRNEAKQRVFKFLKCANKENMIVLKA